MRRRIVVAAMASLLSCLPSRPPELVSKEMLWIDPPTPHPGIPVPHEPNTIDLAFPDGPSYHVQLQSAPILSLLRRNGKKRVRVVFAVTRGMFNSNPVGYYLVSIEDQMLNPQTDRPLGNPKYGDAHDPIPFSE